MYSSGSNGRLLSHAGGFAADYRKLFGELPSETLGQAALREGQPTCDVSLTPEKPEYYRRT